jgi:hypothetical protein
MAAVGEASSDRQTARRRAEVIMKVRCLKLTPDTDRAGKK